MYVVFEGVDCVGKSTQIELLKKAFLEEEKFIFTLEPGGTKLGENLRELLLGNEEKDKKKNNKNSTLSPRAKVLLFLADRAEHYEKILKNNEDKIIISDRSLISGMAYADDFSLPILFDLNAFALNNFFPQKIIFLRGDEGLLRARLLQKSSEKKLDKIEKDLKVKDLLKIQERIKESLEFLKDKFDFGLLILDAAEEEKALHEKIKDFLK